MSNKCYEHKPDTVANNETHVVLWDVAMHTDRQMHAERSDPIIKDQVALTYKLTKSTVLRRILDFEHSRNQRQGSQFFLGK